MNREGQRQTSEARPGNKLVAGVGLGSVWKVVGAALRFCPSVFTGN